MECNEFDDGFVVTEDGPLKNSPEPIEVDDMNDVSLEMKKGVNGDGIVACSIERDDNDSLEMAAVTKADKGTGILAKFRRNLDQDLTNLALEQHKGLAEMHEEAELFHPKIGRFMSIPIKPK